MTKLCLSGLLLLQPCFCAMVARAQPPVSPWPGKPYRALLVVETWYDPASVLVDHEKDDFQPIAALLKAWSVPFDILRLDQQHLDATYLFDRSGKVRYGVVLWLADLPSYTGQNLTSLEDAAHAGTSLLVAKSRFADPALERLLGLKFKAPYTATDLLQVTKDQFITRELAARKLHQLNVAWDFSTRLWVEPQGAEVLIDQNYHPVLTVHQAVAGTSAIWLGVPTTAQLRDSAYWREIFFRSLVWSFEYLVQPDVDYAHHIVLEADDWGTSDKGYLSYWRYPEPSEETLRKHLIEPLEKRRATISANVVTGYVDRKSKRVESPWTQRFKDAFGVDQDYASTRKGLKEAVEAGVVEIESHGWTHMEPDLESPPGPWWTAEMAGEASVDGWYSEFEDHRRATEIPAIVQLFHMKRSREYLIEDFGATPLSLRPGNAGWSKSYANHTGRLAAQAGFGLFHAEPDFVYYLERDLVLDITGIAREAESGYDRPLKADAWPVHPDGPVFLTFHDRDFALQPDFLDRLFAELPAGLETLSANRYIGLLHTRIESQAAAAWQLTFDFDEEYCPYFAHHGSSWRVWLSDPLAERLKSIQELSVRVDGNPPAKVRAADFQRGNIVLEIPAGLGRHVWRLESAR